MKTAKFHLSIGPVILLALLAGLTMVEGQIVQLAFPLNSGQFTNPWTAPITSVFDHAMSFRFESNGVMVAYTGETGTIPDPNEPPAISGTQILYSFKKADSSPFVINGHYVGTTTTHSNTLNYDGHPGYDYPVEIGTEVRAAANGMVLNAVPTDSGPSGKYIQITHTGTSYLSQYLHLSAVYVTNNQSVLRGDLIGLSGNTGGVAPHLHFETKISVAGTWVSVDPYGWQGSGADPYTSNTGVMNLRLWANSPTTGEAITNIMSPVVSYQYYDALGTGTNLQIISPVVSYEYFDWAGDDVLNSKSSPVVSYLYPLLDTPLLSIFFTNRVPKTAESTPAYILSPPPLSKFLVYHGGIFTTNRGSIDTNRMTVVLTHGWNSNPNAWPSNMAALLAANANPRPNIVAWDWSFAANAALPGTPEAQTGDQGRALGEILRLTLGANYSKPIQFIGHSLGTLVNASAANYLHGDRWAGEVISPTPWPGTNTLMTLFDEAEAATGIINFKSAIDILLGKNGNPLLPKTAYDHPLPKRFAWAENYVAAFGLLHPEAANVILTNNFPTDEPNGFSAWRDALTAFHSYPTDWYDDTIQTDNSAMGFVWPYLWSLRDIAFAQAPSAGSVYIQAGFPWHLTATNWTYGTNFLNTRFQAYRNAVAYLLTGETPESVAINGSGNGQLLTGPYLAINGLWDSFIMSLLTTPANTSPAPQFMAHPRGSTPSDANGDANIPAYAWIPLVIPASAVSMSFDYKIQGDWQSDSLAAAFNGTNALSLPGSQLETNILFSSGSIDVSAFAGQTNELFIGIVGGTSTNAQLTVQNLAFSISSPPLLKAQAWGNGFILTWPLSAADYILQTSTNLTDINSWAAVPNVPAIVNLQNAVTNSISDGARFYRLKK